MKRFFLAVTGIILLAGSAYAQENDKRNTLLSNALIVFFSATGTTAGPKVGSCDGRRTL